MSPRLWTRLLPAAAAVLLFLPVLGADLVYDDLILLRDNPSIRDWSTLWRGFAHPFWALVPDPRHHGTAGFYRPLGSAAFVLLWKAGGGAPWAFHGAALLLHGLGAALVAKLALQLSWKPAAAAAAGLLFAVHGAHVENVAWASALPYLLAGCFSLLALSRALAGRPAQAALWLIPAMLSQETAIAAWLLAVAMHLLAGRDSFRQRLKSCWPFLAAALLVYGLRVVAFGGDWRAGFERRITYARVPWQEDLAYSLSLIVEYLRFLVWPWPHEPFRARPVDVTLADSRLWAPALLGALLSAGAAVLWLWRGRRSNLVLLPLGLLFATLAPVLNTRSLGQFPMEERFLYLPSAGFCLLAAGLLGRVAAGWPLLAAGGMLHAYSVHQVLPHWRNEESLYTWAVRASPDAMLSQLQLGRIRLEEAQRHPEGSARRWQLAQEARRAFEAALAVDSSRVFVSAADREQGNVGLANALFVEGDLRTAEAAYREILKRWPDSVEGNLGLGAGLAKLAERALLENQEEEARRQFEEGLAAYEKALARSPLARAKFGKGYCLARLGRAAEALPWLEAAFAEDPGSFAYAQSLAQTYAQLERVDSARRTYEQFFRAAPNAPERVEAYLDLGSFYGALADAALLNGRGAAAQALAEEARGSYERALTISPGLPEALAGLGSSLANLGRYGEALRLLEAAVAAQPADLRYTQTLASLYAEVGRLAAAREAWRSYLERVPDTPLRAEIEKTIQALEAAGAR